MAKPDIKIAGPITPFTSYQKFVVGMLAFLQFTIILDFMILSPLGATLIPALKITPSQFGLVVSAYAFCAGISGFLTAGFADRFDRKKMLLFFYGGFLVGTLLCGLATNYQFLLIARMVTGVFSGVIGSIVFAITADLFPFEMRGRVMGVVQTAFSGSQVLGIPIGLYVSNHWGWNSTFLMIVALGVIAGIVLMIYLKPINEHLKLQVDRSPLHHLLSTVSKIPYLHGFATTALLSVGGFMLLPFASAFAVHNLGVDLSLLPMVYMTTGGFSMLMGPYLGRLSDRIGKFNTFLMGGCITISSVLVYTNLGVTPLFWVIVVNAILYTGVSARIIASSALISAIPAPNDRGAYMSVSSSIQQISGGCAAILAGLLVSEGEGGVILHFDRAGYCVAGSTVVTIILMSIINRKITRQKQVAPAPAMAAGH
jgi:predicted MFS family arabinose efflux permease